jgi:hypothetical protein
MTSLVVRGLVKESTGVNGEGWQSVSSHQQTIVSQRLINAVIGKVATDPSSSGEGIAEQNPR